MNKYILLTLITSFIALVSINAENSQNTQVTYQHYIVKGGSLTQFQTIGLPEKEKFKLIAAIIPKDLPGILASANGEVRAFVQGDHLIFKTKKPEEVLAKIRLLTNVEIPKQLKKFESLSGNKGISLQLATKKTLFIAVVASIKSKIKPLEDYLYSIEKKETSLVAGFSVVRSKKGVSNQNRNVSLLFQAVSKGSPKGYQDLLTNVQKFSQMLTLLPWSPAQIRSLNQYFEKILASIDSLSSKYPEKMSEFINVRKDFVKLAEDFLSLIPENKVGAQNRSTNLTNNIALIESTLQFKDNLFKFFETGSFKSNLEDVNNPNPPLSNSSPVVDERECGNVSCVHGTYCDRSSIILGPRCMPNLVNPCRKEGDYSCVSGINSKRTCCSQEEHCCTYDESGDPYCSISKCNNTTSDSDSDSDTDSDSDSDSDMDTDSDMDMDIDSDSDTDLDSDTDTDIDTDTDTDTDTDSDSPVHSSSPVDERECGDISCVEGYYCDRSSAIFGPKCVPVPRPSASVGGNGCPIGLYSCGNMNEIVPKIVRV